MDTDCKLVFLRSLYCSSLSKANLVKPMYQSLFAKMNFVSVTFFDHSIGLVGTESEILRSRRFRLSPPFALSKVMIENFGYTQEKVEKLKASCIYD